MNRKTATFTVTINLDGTGYGTMGTSEQATKDLQSILDQAISHYNPTVTFVEEND